MVFLLAARAVPRSRAADRAENHAEFTAPCRVVGADRAKNFGRVRINPAAIRPLCCRQRAARARDGR
jgi:hypothetical protein